MVIGMVWFGAGGNGRRALCAAVDQVLSPAMAGISEVFSDSTVERWRSEELGVLRSERPRLSA